MLDISKVAEHTTSIFYASMLCMVIAAIINLFRGYTSTGVSILAIVAIFLVINTLLHKLVDKIDG